MREDDGHQLSSRLRLPFYYSKTPDKGSVFDGWVANGRWIVATYALSHGIDYGRVRYVLHAAPPRGLLEYVQETGRAGRDGGMALCRMYIDSSRGRPTYDAKNPDTEGIVGMRKLLKNAKECRRLALTEFLDGQGRDCASTPNATLCDACDLKANNMVRLFLWPSDA